MLLSDRSTTNLRLPKIRRLAVGPSRRWPLEGFEMTSTTSDNPSSSTPVLNHHWTGGPSWITGYEWTYDKLSTISGAVKSILIGGRGLDRIGPSSKIRSST